MAETARDAVDGAEISYLRQANIDSDSSGVTLSEQTPLLSKTAHAQIDDSIRTFMAMCEALLFCMSQSVLTALLQGASPADEATRVASFTRANAT